MLHQLHQKKLCAVRRNRNRSPLDFTAYRALFALPKRLLRATLLRSCSGQVMSLGAHRYGLTCVVLAQDRSCSSTHIDNTNVIPSFLATDVSVVDASQHSQQAGSGRAIPRGIGVTLRQGPPISVIADYAASFWLGACDVPRCPSLPNMLIRSGSGQLMSLDAHRCRMCSFILARGR